MKFVTKITRIQKKELNEITIFVNYPNFKSMSTFSLNAISPIDGRYQNKVSQLSDYFSEHGLIKNRVIVEVEYFISLCEIPLPQLKNFDKSYFAKLRDIYKNFSFEDSTNIKEIEKTTNHDVKAVEYFIKEKFDKLGIEEFKEFIHFGLTSQDINNTCLLYTSPSPRDRG